MDEAALIQRLTQRAHAAVHHVGRRDDVDSRFRLRERLPFQDRDGLVVQNVAGFIDDTVLTVTRIRIERDVAHDAELGKALFERFHCARNQSARIGRLTAIRCLERGLDGRKQGQRRNAQLETLLRQGQQSIDRQPLHAGHRRHRLRRILPLEHKHGIDEIVGGHTMLACQPA